MASLDFLTGTYNMLRLLILKNYDGLFCYNYISIAIAEPRPSFSAEVLRISALISTFRPCCVEIESPVSGWPFKTFELGTHIFSVPIHNIWGIPIKSPVSAFLNVRINFCTLHSTTHFNIYLSFELASIRFPH